MARTGLRMMPTFPSSSLKFRTAGFTQYGFKAGLSGEAFPSDLSVKPAPGMPFTSHGLPSPFALSVVVPVSPLSVGTVTRWNAAVRGVLPLCPRGPRSGPGYSVPVHLHLLDPIRPACRHIATSPQSGLYAMPSLCGSASATHKRFRAFTDRSFSTCRPQRPRRARRLHSPSSFTDGIGLHPSGTGSALSMSMISRLTVRLRYDLPSCSPPFETFTPGLPTSRSPFSPPGITTVSNWAIYTGGTRTHWNGS